MELKEKKAKSAKWFRFTKYNVEKEDDIMCYSAPKLCFFNQL